MATHFLRILLLLWQQVLSQTQDHRRRVLVAVAKNIKVWQVKARKIKAIYHTLNMCNLDVTQKCLIGECWCPVRDLDKIQMALRRGTVSDATCDVNADLRNEMGDSLVTRLPVDNSYIGKFLPIFRSEAAAVCLQSSTACRRGVSPPLTTERTSSRPYSSRSSMRLAWPRIGKLILVSVVTPCGYFAVR